MTTDELIEKLNDMESVVACEAADKLLEQKRLLRKYENRNAELGSIINKHLERIRVLESMIEPMEY